MAKRKIGFINVGQGPRADFLSVHRNWLDANGLKDVEILQFASLDGLSYEEIHEVEGPAFDPDKPLYSPDTRCGAFVHREGVDDLHLGEGWWEVWTPRRFNEKRIQRSIDKLEEAGAEVIILCCCLEYPVNAFKSKVPFVMPYKATFAYVEALADTMDKPEVGIVIGRGQNWQRDIDMWTRNRWSRDVNLHFGVGHVDGEGVKALSKDRKKYDLLVVWGYHTFDLRGGKVGDTCLEIELAKQFDCPVVSSMSAALLFARGLLRPPMDERSYYKPLRSEKDVETVAPGLYRLRG
jgi:hypothetical protein